MGSRVVRCLITQKEEIGLFEDEVFDHANRNFDHLKMRWETQLIRPT